MSNHVLLSDLVEIIVTKIGRGTGVDVSEKETIVEEGINSLLERRRRPLPSPSLKGIGRNRKICFKHVMRNWLVKSVDRQDRGGRVNLRERTGKPKKRRKRKRTRQQRMKLAKRERGMKL